MNSVVRRIPQEKPQSHSADAEIIELTTWELVAKRLLDMFKRYKTVKNRIYKPEMVKK